MTYKIIKQVEHDVTETGEQTTTLVQLSKEHLVADFDNQVFTTVGMVLVETGHMDASNLGDGNFDNFQATRVVASCEQGHDHKIVIYQAPREMEVWEALFAIGEVPEADTSA